MTRLMSWGIFAFVAAAVLILDRGTKMLAADFLPQARSIEVLPGVFNLTLVMNTGSAFGLLREKRFFFISVTILSIAFIIFYIWKHKTGDIFSLVALSLITGGALGNLIDRVIYGHVIDFLDFRVWPVFNVADSAITIGAAILIFKIMAGSLSIGR